MECTPARNPSAHLLTLAGPLLPALPQSGASTTKLPPYSNEEEQRYAEHPWNINNMPRSRGSVLRCAAHGAAQPLLCSLGGLAGCTLP